MATWRILPNAPSNKQQLSVEESISGRAVFCPGVKKLTQKVKELIISQRPKDAKGKGKPLHERFSVTSYKKII